MLCRIVTHVLSHAAYSLCTLFFLGDRNYQELRQRKEEALSLREWVLVKVYEIKKLLRTEIEGARKRCDELTEQNLELS